MPRRGVQELTFPRTDHSRPTEQLWTVGEASRRFQDGCKRTVVDDVDNFGNSPGPSTPRPSPSSASASCELERQVSARCERAGLLQSSNSISDEAMPGCSLQPPICPAHDYSRSTFRRVCWLALLALDHFTSSCLSRSRGYHHA